MARGSHWWNEPPWWAWTIMVVAGVLLAVGLPYGSSRGQLSAAEWERLTAATTETETPPPPPPPEEKPGTVTVRSTGDGPLRILFAGDSITQGAHTTAEELSYRSIVTSSLSADSDWIGGSGLTTAEVLPDAQAVTDSYDLLVVALGTNDVYERTAPSDFTDAYAGLLDSLTAASPEVAIVCVGVWPTQAALPYADAIASVCAERGGVTVTISDLNVPANIAAEGEPYFLGGEADGFHPGNEGHRAIADRVLAAVSVGVS